MWQCLYNNAMPEANARLKEILASFAGGSSAKDSTTDLLVELGYDSERVVGENPSVEEWIELIRKSGGKDPNAPRTMDEALLKREAKTVEFVLSFDDEDMQKREDGLLTQKPADFSLKAPSKEDFLQNDAEKFFFFAIALKGKKYTRSQYAGLTRVLSKHTSAPTVAVFFTPGNERMSIAFYERRINKRDPNRDVLGKVSVIRDIETANPHHAHLMILDDLRLRNRARWITERGELQNFIGLHKAWMQALDTEALNKRFYGELYAWFCRVVKEGRFPPENAKPGDKRKATQAEKQKHAIRLLTRLMFIWFIKQQGLIADELFNTHALLRLLKNFNPTKGDSYYRAVLQNLFFATLNTEIKSRGFTSGQNKTHRVFSCYRYKAQMSEPEKLIKLFNKTPFVNGGLFDCLDSEEATGEGGIRVDCFSDAHHKMMSLPNALFFDNEGLIPLFEKYKFTVEESTPVEEEVALDPELLGKAFENLLAAGTPETQDTVRKQTGSFYTPRVVVDYMVSEAILAFLQTRAQLERDDWQERLRYLLNDEAAFEDVKDLFGDGEKKGIVCAIAELKIIDPAVGSGAFPMTILHKLTMVLRRLDPRNKLWRKLQIERVSQRAEKEFSDEKKDKEERDKALNEINFLFERYKDSDFGRKLYLIQNCVYGVDIQPTAAQIAKLRFFISLAIEQERNDTKGENYGFKPLPNLETKFIIADTLGSLTKEGNNGSLAGGRVPKILEELKENRERHFHATQRKDKLACKNKDSNLRKSLQRELAKNISGEDAEKISKWDPFDQNAVSKWFDSKYMFNVTGGFDIVIGNPPYKQIPKKTYSALRFPYSEGKDKGKQNLYKLFAELSHKLTRKDGGIGALIVQNTLMCDLSAAGTRELLLNEAVLCRVVEFPAKAKTRDAQVFESVVQGTCAYQFINNSVFGKGNYRIAISIDNDSLSIKAPVFCHINKADIAKLYPDMLYLPRVREGAVSILNHIAKNPEIKLLKNFAHGIKQGDINLTGGKDDFSHVQTPVRLLRGKHISRYHLNYMEADEYILEGRHTDKIDINKKNVFLVSQEVTFMGEPRRLVFALHENLPAVVYGHSVNKTYHGNPEVCRYLLAVLNSKFMDWFFRATSSNNHVQGYELSSLPILHPSKKQFEAFLGLIDEILIKGGNNQKAEAEIDQMVYDLYGLSSAQRKLIEGKYKKP